MTARRRDRSHEAGALGDSGAVDGATGRLVLHLMGCALSGRAPRDVPESANWRQVFEISCNNSISGLLWAAAGKVSTVPEDVRAAWERSARMTALRTIQFDAERAVVVAALRERGLSCLPLKGAVLASLYPDPSMRSMSDNDLLYGFVEPDGCGGFQVEGADGERRQATIERARACAVEAMEGLGYRQVAGPLDACDTHFAKPPYLNFELHHGLVRDTVSFAGYYRNPWERARPVANPAPHEADFAFSEEDFYLYAVLHAKKHFDAGGAGARFLADIHMLLNAYGKTFSRDYVDRELERVGALGFERRMRELSDAVCSGADLSDEDLALASRLLACGTYGSDDEALRKRMERGAHGGPFANRLREIRRFLFSGECCPPELAHLYTGGFRLFYPFAKCLHFARLGLRDPQRQLRKLRLFFRGGR